MFGEPEDSELDSMRVLNDIDIEGESWCVCACVVFLGCGSTALLICFLVANFTYTEK